MPFQETDFGDFSVRMCYLRPCWYVERMFAYFLNLSPSFQGQEVKHWKHEGTKDVREALVVIAFHSRLDFALAGARYTTFWNWVSEEFGRRRRARARSSWSMALCSISSCSVRERHGGKSNGEETAQKYIINMWNGCDLSLNLSPLRKVRLMVGSHFTENLLSCNPGCSINSLPVTIHIYCHFRSRQFFLPRSMLGSI